jgi:hypothetical protein
MWAYEWKESCELAYLFPDCEDACELRFCNWKGREKVQWYHRWRKMWDVMLNIQVYVWGCGSRAL